MVTQIENIKFFTVQETAGLLRVTPQTVRAYIKQGKLKGKRIGRPILISEDNIREFLTTPEAPTSVNTTLQK
ncbi:MAG: helix-turn-helix domain-containing protein [Candidatus Neomarinimicrobiota bacterium]|jgi:excisionase family DNA binding protein